MESTELFDMLIRAGLRNRCADDFPYYRQTDEALWEKIWEDAQFHQVWGIIAKVLEHAPSEMIPAHILEKFLKIKNELSYQYYSVFSFTTLIMDLLKGENFFVLKGITLNSLYPDPGMRKLSDVDIYVKPSRIRTICKKLDQHGFQSKKEIWDYHKVYFKNIGERKLILELHSRPAGRMASGWGSEMELFRIYNRLEKPADIYRPENFPVPALPPAEYAMHLLLHMMNHFMGNEFGFWLLCDWTVFWTKKGDMVDKELFRELLKKSGMEEFARIMTGICIRHFGLSRECTAWMEAADRMPEKEEAVYTAVMNRKTCRKNSSSLNVIWNPYQPVMIRYMGELHRQMRFRFPKLGCIAVFWPILWTAAIVIFCCNNRILGREKIGTVLKKANETDDIELLEQAGLIKKEEK